MAGKPPYFPLYVKDFAADAKVEAMTPEEVGGYILILCKAWHEDIPGSVPDDNVILSRWSRLGERWQKCRDAILAAFTKESDGRLHQKRLQHEHQKLTYVSKRRADGGRKCASIKKKKTCDSKNDHAHHDAEHDAQHVLSTRKKDAPGSGSGYESKKGVEVYGEGGGSKVWADPESPNLGGYYPMLLKPARDIVAHFQKTLGSFHGTSGGESAVIAALVNDSEATPEVLKLCAERLAVKMNQQEVEKQHIPCVRTFYGTGGYTEFVYGQTVCGTIPRKSDVCFTETPVCKNMHPGVKRTADQLESVSKRLREKSMEVIEL